VDPDKFVGVDKKGVKALVKASFSMRRKTLANNLITSYGVNRERVEDALAKLNLDSRIRGEVLDVNQYISLFNALSANK
ncbi:MAG: 16S rRNA (adenine(1518)-N(6)/adenine(1519)-N(6))-dimethyltransferase, partial [Clostridia bacterium]